MPGPLSATDTRRFDLIKARLDRTSQPLANGEKGAAVRALENLLGSLGFTPGPTDGQFDARLQGTVKNFQAAMGLEATGQLDGKTLAALRTAVKSERGLEGIVSRGQKGDDIARVERQLDRLGYDVGTKDGICDGQLGEALVAFKRDQGEFDNRAPVLSLTGQAVLSAESKGLQHAAWHGRAQLTPEQHRMDGVLAELSKRPNADGSVGLGEGAQRPAIEMMQTRLRAAGFDPQRTDGLFDERTRGALEAFQKASGIEVTGRLDPATWGKLKHTIIDTDQAAAPVQGIGEKSAAVKRTEKLLQKAGFGTGEVDGLYTKATARAVRQFERQTHRPVNGVVGERDLAGLKQLAKNPFTEPKSDYTRVNFRDGEIVNQRTIEMLKQAEAWAKQHGVPPGWGLWQGSYSTDVPDSANTHAGGGALDIKIGGKTNAQIATMVEALRRAGFAAWDRPTMSPRHIHAIAIGDRQMSSDARNQVREYFAGGDGLDGSFRDPNPSRPIPEWAKKFR